MSGRLEEIWVAPAGGEDMEARDEVRAVEGRGLEGDRYFRGSGTWSRPGLWSPVTLVEGEAVDAAREELGVPVEAAALRRNLLTRGVDLGTLQGRRFRVGSVLLEGVRPCDPCGHLETLAGVDGLKETLADRGGLRARILRGGRIRRGDRVEELGPAEEELGDG